MTYDEYIAETTANCKTVLTECIDRELEDVEHIRRILWEDDRVTGVIQGECSSAKESVAKEIEGFLFDEAFLKDFNEVGMNMQNVMAYGPRAIDVVARCLALKHISINELIKQEQERRSNREKQARQYSSARV